MRNPFRQCVRLRESPPRGIRTAFTLAETLIASVILAVAVAAISQAITVGQTQTYEAVHELRATQLLEAMMDEILAHPYADPSSPDSESTRDTFDDMQDYDGYSESVGTIADIAGLAYVDNYTKFARSVAIVVDPLTVSDLGGDINGLTITITVTDANDRQWTLTRFVPEPTSS